jgi:DNA-directed RNA polymerase specialized sigma24 family protein
MAIFQNELDDYLHCFLHRNPIKTEKFITAATPFMKKLSLRAARWIPDDRHDEVINQTYLNLLISPASSFDPNEVDAKRFIRRKLFNAIRQVNDSYRSPGQPSRGRRKDAPALLNEKVTDKTHYATTISIDSRDFLEPVATHIAESIEAACDVAMLLEMAPGKVSAGLRLMYMEGYTGAETAEILNISRASLYMKISEFARLFRVAA